MDDQPFDLKLLPDWLKEDAFENRYADHQGEPMGRDGRPRESRDGRDSRGPRNRPPQGRDNRPRQGPGNRSSDPRKKGGDRNRGDNRPKGSGPRPQGDRPAQATQSAEPPPPEVLVEFLPRNLEALVQQVQSGSRAYPLFGLARVFLEKPERHRVRLTSRDAAVPLHQCGEDGPIALDPRAFEKEAFEKNWERHYSKETIQRDPPKGNYTNVARCRLSGTLLGPTNHHSYQSALRKLYEERFQRRMSFPDFQREIEVISDPKLVDEWKEAARASVRFTTLNEPEPLVFDSAAAAEEHFRKTYLAAGLRSAPSFEISGPASRDLSDRRLASAVRQTWENERKFPVNFGQTLRRKFAEAGLHIFKYHKRVLFVSAIRPIVLKTGENAFSETIREILKTIEAKPRCTRNALATAVQAARPAEDPAKLKETLAGDLRWLIRTGYVIEFHDGTLDFPPAPKPNEPKTAEPKSGEPKAAKPEETSAATTETASEAKADPESQSEAPAQSEPPAIAASAPEPAPAEAQPPQPPAPMASASAPAEFVAAPLDGSWQ